MSHSNRNFVLAYIFLVGLPVLGLVGVLKSGRSLTAPFSVDGTWKMQANDPPSDSPCNQFFSSLSGSPWSLSQSGKTVVIALGGGSRTTIGSLEGKTLTAQFTGADGPAECADRSLTLSATLDPQTEPRTLRGTLAADNCAGCSLEFRAVRQPHSAPGSAH